MKNQKIEMEDLKKIIELIKSAENLWNKGKQAEVNSSLQDTIKYIERTYPKAEKLHIEDVISDYNNKCATALNKRVTQFGHAYHRDAKESFIKMPELFWKAFDDMKKDEDGFLDKPTGDYGPSQRRNLEFFVKNVVYYFFMDSKGNQLPISKLEEIEDKNDVTKKIVEDVRASLKARGDEAEKEDLVKSLKETISQLSVVGYLSKNLEEYYALMNSFDLTDFVHINVHDEENGPLSESVLKACDFMQLEGLHSFYSNRLTKIEEDIGIGLFLLSTLSSYDIDDRRVLKADDGAIKKKWMEYFILRFLLEENTDELEQHCTVEKGVNGFENLKGYNSDDVYDVVYKKYKSIMKNLFDIDEETFKKDVITFGEAVGLSMVNNYKLKNGAIEDMIIQASETKINWGYIPENESSFENSRFVLLGFDIPGLSMPVRLHFPKETLLEIMKEYLKTDELPIYIGNDDFKDAGRNVGTPLIFPIDKRQKEFAKGMAKTKNPRVSRAAVHIGNIHYSNPISRLLKSSGVEKGKYPDYINVDTGKIRRNNIGQDI